jgi:hypothetical protein
MLLGETIRIPEPVNFNPTTIPEQESLASLHLATPLSLHQQYSLHSNVILELCFALG